MTAVDTQPVTFTGEIHPAAADWPDLAADDLAELAESIASIGLTDPLTLDPDGRLLDGRNRLEACRLANVEPTYWVYDGDPIDFIIARNANRRHMSTGARAMATAKNLVRAGKRTNGRWKYGSLSESTESGGLSNRLREAGTVLDYAPDLADAVIDGSEVLSAAVKVATERKAAANSDAAKLERLDNEAPDLAARVRDETLTLAEAFGALQEREAERQRDIATAERAVLDFDRLTGGTARHRRYGLEVA